MTYFYARFKLYYFMNAFRSLTRQPAKANYWFHVVPWHNESDFTNTTIMDGIKRNRDQITVFRCISNIMFKTISFLIPC